MKAESGIQHEVFVNTHPQSMFYHSGRWRNFLEELLNIQANYLTNLDMNGEISACFSIFVRNGEFGKIANSLPFFGSHGGILASNAEKFLEMVEKSLVFFKENQIKALNIVAPLFAENVELYSHFPVAETDKRLGQYKILNGLKDREGLLKSLGGLVQSNLKRRCWKNDLKVYRDESEKGLEVLFNLHLESMGKKPGGNPKTKKFFELIPRYFSPGVDYKVYFCKKAEKTLGALLLFYWRNYIEYFIPAFDDVYTEYQPMTAIAFEAMLDGIREGFKIWNFGGTWISQEGVKKFKDSWGCETREYKYFCIDFGGLEELKRVDRKELLKEYYGFYVYPFK